jgi:type IV pilus assembly protein PilC
MNRFLYCAFDRNGKTIEGELHAQNFAEAVDVLQAKNLSIQHIAQVPQIIGQTERNLKQAIADPSSFQVSREQALVNAKSWAGPLNALAGEIECKHIRNSLEEISEKLLKAEDIGVIAAEPKTADLLPVFLREWQTGGTNFDWMDDLNYQPWGRATDRYALLYALLCLAAALGLLVAFAIGIVPIFSQMFTEFGMILPPPTRLLLWVSSQINDHPARTLLAVVLFSAIFMILRFALRRSFYTNKLLFPVMPEGRKRVGALAVLVQNTAELLALGYGNAAAVELAAKGCRDPFYRRLALDLADEMSKGINPVYSSSAGWLPALLRQTLDSAQAIDAAKLRQLGLLYRHRWRRCGSSGRYVILSQIVLIFAGGILGFAMVSLFLPFLSLITGLAA